MTAQVSIDLRAPSYDDDVTSPELALVDPHLNARARARLPDVVSLEVYAARALPARGPALVFERPRVATRDIRAHTVARWGRRIRWTAVCAVVTVLVLLLVDPRTRGPGDRAADGGSSTSAPSLGTPASPAGPAKRVHRPSAPTERRFAWSASPRATGYHVEFFRGGRRVFARDTATPEVVMPARWTYQGSTRSFHAGEYRWYVWPVVAGLRQSPAAVQATLTIPAD
jgi:hypothetical protein